MELKSINYEYYFKYVDDKFASFIRSEHLLPLKPHEPYGGTLTTTASYPLLYIQNPSIEPRKGFKTIEIDEPKKQKKPNKPKSRYKSKLLQNLTS